ncbi:MAG: DUF6088 family protein [Bacteroidales bacterium]|nr:DUF6088 family protein [Bacteroidales bacterium]
MQSIEKQIESKIKRLPKGTLLFPEDFSKYGSSEAVRIALYRIYNKGLIKRVAHGIYVQPKHSEFLGELLPTAEDVAYGIAKRDKIRIVPTGVFALNALGLSTQVPMKLVLLTDGAPREIKVGNRSIKFKKTTPKNLMAKGKISSLVIQALRAIGKDKVSEDEENKIVELLRKENKKHLEHDILLAPQWIRKIMKKSF